MFSAGDFLVRIGRYFDRMAVDTRLTFEEWTPPDGRSFVINATEIRGVNFTMTPTGHKVRRLEANCDDVALVEIAHIRRPALEVLRACREAVGLDDLDRRLVVRVALEAARPGRSFPPSRRVAPTTCKK